MKLKVLVGALVFLIVVNLATIGTFLYVHFTRRPFPPAAEAPEFPPRDASMRRPGLHRLPTEDREALAGLLNEFHSETEDLRTKLRALEGGVFDLMEKDPVPVARVDSLLEEISRVRFEISRIATRKLIEAKGILPPEEERVFFDAILQARPAPRMFQGSRHGERPFGGRRGSARPDSLRPTH
jgi:hypothetical protein